MDRIVIRTNWTNTVQETHTILLDDLLDGTRRDLLRAAFDDPERLKPTKTRDALTAEAAQRFAALAQRLRARGHAPETVAHFVNRLVFCMFAEDVNLLPGKLFEAMLIAARPDPSSFATHASTLFAAMRTGGLVGFTRVDWFNGGLFDDDTALPLERADLDDLIAAARLNWSQIDPSILGTLFERGLDPGKRSQLGAHYTDRDKIMKIVNPVIVDPLLAEWAETKAAIETALARERAAKSPAAATRAHNDALALRTAFLERLRAFRVLDPACGSGNFLYLSLRALKDIEHRAGLEAEAVGLPRTFPAVGPEAVRGIEINPFAAELARVSVWIGEIQWMRANGYDAGRNPILRPLDTIECRDALLNPDGTEANWPNADAIIGNPPFLGAKRMKGSLGAIETDRIRAAFKGRLPGFTDLVCFWFEKSRDQIVSGRSLRTGLVGTNSIAKNTNLAVLRRICDDLEIYEAYADEPWVVDGAAVRVSMICFGPKDLMYVDRKLNGDRVDRIYSDLTSGIDYSRRIKQKENQNVAFVGIQKSGPFDIDGTLARKWLKLPLNLNGYPNSKILKPTLNGSDLTTARRDVWFIDFHRGLTEEEAALWEAPFEFLKTAPYDPKQPEQRSLKTARAAARDWQPKEQWWTAYWPRPDLRNALVDHEVYIATPMTAEHRIFLKIDVRILPDNNLVVIARSDDTAFGILQSSFHEVWSTASGNRMGVGNQRRYNREFVFDTFPFPEGLTPDIPASAYAGDPRAQAIATAAADLNTKREAWLNPPDLVRRVPEVVPDYPDRILPVDDAAAEKLKKRTLTNLYNARPAWLDHAHRALDAAVADAYGWGDDWRAGRLTDDTILARLFHLNQERAKTGR